MIIFKILISLHKIIVCKSCSVFIFVVCLVGTLYRLHVSALLVLNGVHCIPVVHIPDQINTQICTTCTHDLAYTVNDIVRT